MNDVVDQIIQIKVIKFNYCKTFRKIMVSNKSLHCLKLRKIQKKINKCNKL